jgi:hypothetical protein
MREEGTKEMERVKRGCEGDGGGQGEYKGEGRGVEGVNRW